MKVLVTGGTGMVEQAFVARLLNDRKIKVVQKFVATPDWRRVVNQTAVLVDVKGCMCPKGDSARLAPRGL